MTNTATTSTAGKTVELGRYECREGVRALVARRIGGEVRVFDCPLGWPEIGTAYRVDAGFETKAELAGFVAEYLRNAAQIGCSPMSAEALEELVVASKEALS